MARADNPVRRDRAERVQAAITRVWENRGGETLSITRGARRLEFYRPPGVITGDDGEIIGVDAWVRLYNVNTGAEIRIDPHRRIVNPPTVPRSGVLEVPDPTAEDPTRTRRELVVDAAEAFVEAVVDSIQDAPNPAGWRTAGTVTTVFATSALTDCNNVLSINATYATARTGGTLSIETTTGLELYVGQRKISAGNYVVWESLMEFDTSAITDTDVISAVDLALYKAGAGTPASNFLLEARESLWGTDITTADWISGASVSGLTQLATLDTTGISGSSGYKTFTAVPAFLTATGMKTGTVQLLINSSRHRLANAPAEATTERFDFLPANVSGTTQDPKLTITHAAAGGGPPPFQRNPQRIWRRF